MTRKEALCAVIGGVVGAVLVMAVGSFAPLGAQSEVADAEFGTITCSKLVVRDNRLMPIIRTEIDTFGVNVSGKDGRSAELGAVGLFVYGKEGVGSRALVIVGENGGAVRVGKDGGGSARMTITEDGGLVTVHGKDGEGTAGMGIDENGGAVSVHGKDGEGTAGMKITEYGGLVTVHGKDGEGMAGMSIYKNGGSVSVYGKDGEGVAGMNIYKNGGSVYVHRKDGGGMARMEIDEDGGSVYVHGKGNSVRRAVMGVNEYGNGAVSTWDKNGYRLATLK